MKTWKEATINSEMKRLAKGLQKADNVILGEVQIRNIKYERVTIEIPAQYKPECLAEITFLFTSNTFAIKFANGDVYKKTITALKYAVDYCLNLFNSAFDEFEANFGEPYNYFLPVQEEVVVEVEEVKKQPKAEEQQVTVVENPKLFTKTLVQKLKEAGFATTSCKEESAGTYNLHAMADRGVMVDIDFEAGVNGKLSSSVVVSDLADCSVVDGEKYNTEADYIKAIVEKVISSSNRGKKIIEANKLFESTDTTDDKVRKLQKEFKQWEVLQEREKEADEAYEANYTDKELEKAEAEAYAAEYKQYDKIARMIAELINIDVLTAKGMLMKTPKHVKKILEL